MLEWNWTSEDYPDHENFYIQLTNYTDADRVVLVSIREMGMERLITVPPYSTNRYPLGRYPDSQLFAYLVESGVHLFVHESQPGYHFTLGWFVYQPGA